MSRYSTSDAKVLSTETLQTDTKWIKLNKITYKDPSGKERGWETAERTTRPSNTDLDAVGIVAILHDSSDLKSRPSLLLQKQFRPPIDKVTIEVPSGLVDAGETPIDAAIRELREETGYIATPPSSTEAKAAEGFIMWNDPGFCNTNTKMVFLEIDLRNERNQVPKPELEEGEFIETLLVPLEDMWEEMDRLDGLGFGIDARVGTLAQGLEVARRWKAVLDKGR